MIKNEDDLSRQSSSVPVTETGSPRSQPDGSGRFRLVVTYFDQFVPAALRFGNRKWGRTRLVRDRLGLLLPVRCPTCRMFTKQRPVVTGIRQCLSCAREFTLAAARRRARIDGVNWSAEGRS